MNGRSIALIVTGSLATLLAVGLLAGGGLALWGNAQKDSDGYLSTDTHQFEAGTRALATENMDIDLDGADVIMDTGDLGKVRLQVESRDDKPVFVGIARTQRRGRLPRGRLAHHAHGRRARRRSTPTTTTTAAIAARSRRPTPRSGQLPSRARASRP